MLNEWRDFGKGINIEHIQLCVAPAFSSAVILFECEQVIRTSLSL